MHAKKICWWRAVLMAVLSAGLLYCLVISFWLLDHEASKPTGGISDKVYEQINMVFGAMQFTLLFGTLALLSLRGLIHCFWRPEQLGRIGRFLGRRGQYVALACGAASVLVFVSNRLFWEYVQTIPETWEMPSATHERLLHGWLLMLNQGLVQGAILSLCSWIKNRKRV